MSYDYKNGKKRIQSILNSKTEIMITESIPKSEEEFTYENGIKSWVGAIFVDIVDSTSLFKDYKDEKLARIIRAFCSEVIRILKENEKYVQIGIRGDCVYAIYSAPRQDDLKRILSDSIMINTFHKMFCHILNNNSFKSFDIGIGLGASEDLIIKAGQKGSGINDYVWIGSAVVNASKLSSEGNRNNFKSIVIDSCFYNNIKNYSANDDYKYSHYFTQKYSSKLGEYVYDCNMITIDFHDWIEGGMNG
ncbi:MAG: adenylate cyclase [Bacilli bacterium]|nr:adenylate cyclase [Bacilli bacterium]